MGEKKQDSFTITDRRPFTSDGDVRKETSTESFSTSESPVERGAQQAVQDLESSVPPPPSAAEQQAQADAYRESSKELDTRVELSGQSARDLEMTFERFLASLYMTAMLQLGLMHEQGGQPRVDLVAARQTIDTLSLIGDKTKGNLTSSEQDFLQNSLYELRMAYVEVTNALARPPQPAGSDSARR